MKRNRDLGPVIRSFLKCSVGPDLQLLYCALEARGREGNYSSSFSPPGGGVRAEPGQVPQHRSSRGFLSLFLVPGCLGKCQRCV